VQYGTGHHREPHPKFRSGPAIQRAHPGRNAARAESNGNRIDPGRRWARSGFESSDAATAIALINLEQKQPGTLEVAQDLPVCSVSQALIGVRVIYILTQEPHTPVAQQKMSSADMP
jgi:hypothetical protein